jgi:hypothetical protein
MSKPTVSAAGGAMPAEGQFVPRARLGARINIADAFDQTRGLIIAASNMAAALEDTEAQGLHPVILAIEEQFEITRDWFLTRHAGAPTSAPSLDLLDIVDELGMIRSFVEAGWMAAASLPKDECDALQNVLGVAEQRLTVVRDKIDVARGEAPAEGHADV